MTSADRGMLREWAGGRYSKAWLCRLAQACSKISSVFLTHKAVIVTTEILDFTASKPYNVQTKELGGIASMGK